MQNPYMQQTGSSGSMYGGGSDPLSQYFGNMNTGTMDNYQNSSNPWANSSSLTSPGMAAGSYGGMDPSSYGGMDPSGGMMTGTGMPPITSLENSGIKLTSGMDIGDVKELASQQDPRLGKCPGVTVNDLNAALSKLQNGGTIPGKDKQKMIADLNALIKVQSGNASDKIHNIDNLNTGCNMTVDEIEQLAGVPVGSGIDASVIKKAAENATKKGADLGGRSKTEIRSELKSLYSAITGQDPAQVAFATAPTQFKDNTEILQVLEDNKDVLDKASGGVRHGASGSKVRVFTKDGAEKIANSTDDSEYPPKVRDAVKALLDNEELSQKFFDQGDNLDIDDNHLAHVAGLGDLGHDDHIQQMLDDKDKTNKLGDPPAGADTGTTTSGSSSTNQSPFKIQQPSSVPLDPSLYDTSSTDSSGSAGGG